MLRPRLACATVVLLAFAAPPSTWAEPCDDLDRDGLCANVDPDDDGDGVPDLEDLDPRDPYVCRDVDSDGCDDCSIVGPSGQGGLPNQDGPDQDGDGVCDPADWDDDGDGVADALDAAPHDPWVCLDRDQDLCDDCALRGPDGSGGDEMQDGADADADGICDLTDADDDQDGVLDIDDSAPKNPTICRDVDRDGCDDCTYTGYGGGGGDPWRDGPDRDGDGICDSGDVDLDLDGVPDDLDVDTDGDGVPDALEGDGDFDGDGVPNHRDLDADGDGLSDVAEAGHLDLDLDGRVDECVDVSPHDGLCDRLQTLVLAMMDIDNDGLPASLDRDSDGDGLTDVFESGRLDRNGDGRPDVYADYDGDGCDDTGFFPLPDSDGDGAWDGAALDADGDGRPDATEAFDLDRDGRADRAPRGVDEDGDGLDDAFDPSEGGTGVICPDLDQDGLHDAIDVDADGDGVLDRIECRGNMACMDRDGDGLADHLDLDSDGDGRSDLAEAYDMDGNGVPDRGPWNLDRNFDGLDDGFEVMGLTLADLDMDGILDMYDVDDDGDGLLSRDERLAEDALRVDLDGDGRPADKDLDADGDGIADAIEGFADADGDARPDFLDVAELVEPECPTCDEVPVRAPEVTPPESSGCAAVSGSTVSLWLLLLGLWVAGQRRAVRVRSRRS